MTRTIKVASIQMDITPAPVNERLTRAERLANEAAEAGAQLIAFPEVFNTGYVYSPENYALAEPLDGPTSTWMRQTAARLNVHLAGTFLLHDQTDIYNALLLVAPDGRFWRYADLSKCIGINIQANTPTANTTPYTLFFYVIADANKIFISVPFLRQSRIIQ